MNDEDPPSQHNEAEQEETSVTKSKRPSLRDFSRSIFLGAVQKPRLVTCPQGVVTYTIAPDPGASEILAQLFDTQATDQKIREILATNADIDLVHDKEIQAALGITVLSHTKSKSSSLPPGDDIFW